jgi:hypothetical protein
MNPTLGNKTPVAVTSRARRMHVIIAVVVMRCHIHTAFHMSTHPPALPPCLATNVFQISRLNPVVFPFSCSFEPTASQYLWHDKSQSKQRERPCYTDDSKDNKRGWLTILGRVNPRTRCSNIFARARAHTHTHTHTCTHTCTHIHTHMHTHAHTCTHTHTHTHTHMHTRTHIAHRVNVVATQYARVQHRPQMRAAGTATLQKRTKHACPCQKQS